METQTKIRANNGLNLLRRQPRGSVLVIGAGVSGLTSALLPEAERALRVTVRRRIVAPRVTSVVAGACGNGRRPCAATIATSFHWRARRRGADRHTRSSSSLRNHPETGVFVRPVTYYFKRPIDEDRFHQAKMEGSRTRSRVSAMTGR